MNLARVPWYGWLGLGAGGFVVVEALTKSAPVQAAAARGPIAANGDVPPPAIPASTPVQTRPIPAFDGLDPTALKAITRIAQQQLNALQEASPALTLDGVSGPATQNAMAQFLVDYPPTPDQQAAYGALTDGRAPLYELDDTIRLAAGLAAGAAPAASGGLFSPARHRNAR